MPQRCQKTAAVKTIAARCACGNDAVAQGYRSFVQIDRVARICATRCIGIEGSTRHDCRTADVECTAIIACAVLAEGDIGDG